MKKRGKYVVGLIALIMIALSATPDTLAAAQTIAAPGSKLPTANANKVITQSDITVERVGTSIPVSAIGEPVSAVKLSAPRWVTGADVNSS